MVIHHFKLELGINNIEIDSKASPLSVGFRNVGTDSQSLCMWVLRDKDAPTINRRFLVAFTGHEHSELDHISKYNFIGTSQAEFDGFPIVVHVFELF